MDLQDLMRGAPDMTNVVEACNLEGRQERLDELLAQLEMCEKALQVRMYCNNLPMTPYCDIPRHHCCGHAAGPSGPL